MIGDLTPKPPDQLLKLMRAFRDDPRADKIDLGIGVYRNDAGETPIMAAVKQAERLLLAAQTSKAYVAAEGDAEFVSLLGELAFAAGAANLVGVQAVGGTGALRLGCDLLRVSGARRVLLPAPSWPNHPAIIAAAGLEKIDIPFFDIATQRVDLDRLIEGLAKLEPGDAIILQGCCHNPLGADFTLPQWDALADAIGARGLIAFIDIAYQGLGAGIDRDLDGARRLLARGSQALIAVSGSKSFGLYRERVGALYVQGDKRARDAIVTNINAITRANYSMPPDHGAAIVRIVLSDAELRKAWRGELDAMRERIQATRTSLAAAELDGLPLVFIGEQKGMFSTLPLTPARIAAMRAAHAIHMTESGRINVAGLRQADIARFLAALASVLAKS